MERDILIYAILASYLVGVIASAMMYNIYITLISLVLLTAGISLYKGWNIFLPLLIEHSGIVRLIGDYEISGSQAVAVREVNGRFAASAYASLDISDSEGLSAEKLESIISKIGTPFDLTLSVRRLNMDRMLDSMETERHIKENAIARLSGGGNRNLPKINSLRRELEQLELDINGMTSGKVPLQVLYYVSVEAESESRYAAESDAISGIKEAVGAIASASGYQYRLLSGNELVAVLSHGTNIGV